MRRANLRRESSLTCSQCGTRLPGGAFGDSCPSCLLGSGLRANSDVVSPADLDATEVRFAGNGSATQPADASFPRLPQRFGDYELLEEIGRGGMGVVYRARQLSLNRVVAVKMILAGPMASPDFLARFRAEAHAVAHLQHPNIVALHEIGEQQGRQYFSMDYVPGGSLAGLARDRPLAPGQAALYCKALAEAVGHAHELGILHRDLKPSNILIDARGQPRITDFGLAKRLNPEDRSLVAGHAKGAGSSVQSSAISNQLSDLTLTGYALGSPNYSAPEQTAGRRGEVGPRSDIYSVGAILYFLLTGRPPQLGETLEQLLWLVINREPVSPRLLNPGVPLDLETICLKCLEKEPRRRYSNAQQLAEELRRFLEGRPIHARPVGLVGKTWRWCLRNPKLAGLAVLILALLVTVITVTVLAKVRLRAKELTIRQSAYVADMRRAQQALESDNLGLAERLLQRHRPQPGQPDVRGWEWRYLWAQSRSDALFTIGRHANAVLTLAFSRAGTHLASADIDGTVKLWDFASNREIASQPHGNRVDVLAFSPDGKALASAGADGEVRLWAGTTLTEIGRPLRQGEPIFALAFSQDGRRLVALSVAPGTQPGGKVVTWDVVSGQAHDEFKLRACQRATFSPGAALLAAGEANGKITVWDLATKTTVASWLGHANGVGSLAFSADGTSLISGGPNREAKVWHVGTGRECATLGGFNAMVSAAAFSPDGRFAATASYDQTVRLWDVSTWQELATFRGQMSEVWSIAFSPNGDQFATGGKGGAIKVWNSLAKPARNKFTRLTNEGQASFVPGGGLLRRLSSQLCLIDLLMTNREPKCFDFAGINGSVFGASRNGQCAAMGTPAGDLYLWNSASSRRPIRLALDAAMISKLDFSPDAKHLVIVRAHRQIEFLDTSSGRTMTNLSRQNVRLADCAFSQDGRWLGVGFEDGATALWDFPACETFRIFKGHKLSVSGVAFSPTGDRLATASADGTAIVWDIQAGRRISTLEGRGNALWSVSWSPDEHRLATGTGDGTILIWDLASGQEVATLKGHKHSLTQANFLPDGNTLVSCAMDEFFLWHAPFE